MLSIPSEAFLDAQLLNAQPRRMAKTNETACHVLGRHLNSYGF